MSDNQDERGDSAGRARILWLPERVAGALSINRESRLVMLSVSDSWGRRSKDAATFAYCDSMQRNVQSRSEIFLDDLNPLYMFDQKEDLDAKVSRCGARFERPEQVPSTACVGHKTRNK